jgi:hypothetical protein
VGIEPTLPRRELDFETASPVEQSLQAQIDALAAQLSALTDRVTRLEKTGDASWLAFQQAVAGGATVADAADQARGTLVKRGASARRVRPRLVADRVLIEHPGDSVEVVRSESEFWPD